MEVDAERLAEFLVDAKRASWRRDDEKIPEIKGFKEFEYSEGDWRYNDVCAGEYFFCGNEAVRFQEIPVWIMNYDGGINPRFHGNKTFKKRINDFLKKALMQIDVSLPFRGPLDFKEGLDFEGKYHEWIYRNLACQDIRRFEGFEEIWHRGKIEGIPWTDSDVLISVFELNYSGRLII